MDGINEWAFPSTRIADAIRFRPAALGVFYSLGRDPWVDGDESIAGYAAAVGRPSEELIGELKALPVPHPGSDWEALPAFHLIDFLTAQHREFLHADLPALRSLLEMPFREASGGRFFQVTLEGFHAFHHTLADHIHEEEEDIFPTILRNEYVLRFGGSEPDARPAAERLLASTLLMAQEDDLAFVLAQWTDTPPPRNEIRNPPKIAELVAQVMKRLEKKLRAHSDLERNRLFPIAFRLESELAGSAVA